MDTLSPSLFFSVSLQLSPELSQAPPARACVGTLLSSSAARHLSARARLLRLVIQQRLCACVCQPTQALRAQEAGLVLFSLHLPRAKHGA